MGIFSKLLWGSNPRAKIIASYDIPKKFRINPLTGTRISPDGSRVGYVLRLDEPSSETSALVVNGEMVAPDPATINDCYIETGPYFNHDGSQVACGLKADSEYFLLIARINDPANPAVELTPVPGTVAGCLFLDDFDKVIYRVISFDRKKGQKFFLMSDGERISPDFDWVTVPLISEDGKKLVYAAQLGDKCCFMVNDKCIPLDLHRAGTPVLSPDNSKLVFCAEESEDRSCLLYYDLSRNEIRTISNTYSDVSFPSFNRAGTKVLYVADGESIMTYDFHSQKTEKIAGGFSSLREPVYSPDGNSVAYAAKVRVDVAGGVEVFHVFVNDRKATPFYADMSLATGLFEKTGQVCYSAYEVNSKRVLIARVG